MISEILGLSAAQSGLFAPVSVERAHKDQQVQLGVQHEVGLWRLTRMYDSLNDKNEKHVKDWGTVSYDPDQPRQLAVHPSQRLVGVERSGISAASFVSADA